jgi:nicotinamide mononucleotide transporter
MAKLKVSESQVTAALTIAASALAVAIHQRGLASPLEAISFISGAVCVWLTVKENVWNFPIGLVNVATFFVVFARAKLYADAGLQVVYFALGVIGWAMWLRGGEHRTPLRVTRASPRELAILGVLAAIATVGLWKALHEFGGSASFWDALTTSLSLASQWLLNRKRLESWLGWLLVDAIYVPLYISKDLYLTAILYAVFFVMAAMGWRAWWHTWRTNILVGADVGPLVGAAAP